MLPIIEKFGRGLAVREHERHYTTIGGNVNPNPLTADGSPVNVDEAGGLTAGGDASAAENPRRQLLYTTC
jgi:hypothetical protein